MKEPTNVRTLFTAALTLALAGCAHIPADKGALPERAIDSAQLAPGIVLQRDAWPSEQWWRDYGDNQLDALVAQALARSPSLAAARSRIAGANAIVTQERAATGAGIGLEANANRQRYSGNGLFPQPIGGAYFNDVAVQVRAGYDFDWWGKHRAQIGAALGEAQARQAELALAEQLLAAAVAQSYFRLQTDWARLANVDTLARAREAIAADQARRVAAGLASSDGQRNAELELARLGEQAAMLRTDAEREREALRALVDGDGAQLADLAPRPMNSVVHALPARLGMDLLARRADLQAAHWRVLAALDKVDARKAAYYPDINLAGGLGLDTITLGKLLQTGSRTLLLGSTLSLPLFDSASLGAQLGAAQAQRDAIIADYNQAVINAVRDVAQEAVGLRGLEQQLRQHEASRAASVAVLHNVQSRFAQGLADRASLLQAELQVQAQEEQAILLQGAQRQGEIALNRALGGGYQSAAADAKTTQSPQRVTP